MKTRRHPSALALAMAITILSTAASSTKRPTTKGRRRTGKNASGTRPPQNDNRQNDTSLARVPNPFGNPEPQQCFCMEDMDEPSQVSVTSCKHVFHTSCLELWYRSRRSTPTCPTCRTTAKCEKCGENLDYSGENSSVNFISCPRHHWYHTSCLPPWHADLRECPCEARFPVKTVVDVNGSKQTFVEQVKLWTTVSELRDLAHAQLGDSPTNTEFYHSFDDTAKLVLSNTRRSLTLSDDACPVYEIHGHEARAQLNFKASKERGGRTNNTVTVEIMSHRGVSTFKCDNITMKLGEKLAEVAYRCAKQQGRHRRDINWDMGAPVKIVQRNGGSQTIPNMLQNVGQEHLSAAKRVIFTTGTTKVLTQVKVKLANTNNTMKCKIQLLAIDTPNAVKLYCSKRKFKTGSAEVRMMFDAPLRILNGQEGTAIRENERIFDNAAWAANKSLETAAEVVQYLSVKMDIELRFFGSEVSESMQIFVTGETTPEQIYQQWCRDGEAAYVTAQIVRIEGGDVVKELSANEPIGELVRGFEHFNGLQTKYRAVIRQPQKRLLLRSITRRAVERDYDDDARGSRRRSIQSRGPASRGTPSRGSRSFVIDYDDAYVVEDVDEPQEQKQTYELGDGFRIDADILPPEMLPVGQQEAELTAGDLPIRPAAPSSGQRPRKSSRTGSGTGQRSAKRSTKRIR